MRQTCKELLSTFQENGESELLHFLGVTGYDVYNITAPFNDNGKLIIAGRVEKRENEISQVCFFHEIKPNYWQLIDDMPKFDLQDPFITFVNGELIFGGVEIFNPTTDNEIVSWRTILYKGKDIKHLEPFFIGPNGMKDLRICELPDKRILVLTRPQGNIGGRGAIGKFYLEALSELTIDLIEKAPLIEQFDEQEWGGANALYLIDDEHVGVLGHIANFDELGNRHYYAMTFIINFVQDTCSEMKLFATRSEFQAGPYKREDLIDVIFSGGLTFTSKKNEVKFYAGVSDAHAQKITKKNPFLL